MKLKSNFKKFLSVILALSMIFSAIAVIPFSVTAEETLDVWDGTKATAFAGGTGTEADPYLIETPEQLAYMLFFGITTTGQYYELTADIYLNDVSNADWASNSPISWYDRAAMSNTAFVGTLDGAGHTIHGLYYNGSSIVGLFPQASNTTVTNLRISNANITSSSHVAAIISFGQNSATMKKCIVDETVKLATTGSGTGIGAFVGYGSPKVYIYDSAVMASITSPNVDGTGAFVGSVWGNNTAGRVIKNSFSAIDIRLFGHPTQGYTAENTYNIGTEVQTISGTVTKLESADLIKGAQAKTNMPNLDWRSVWAVTESGYPTHRNINGVKGEIWGGTVAYDFAGGTGTAADPYLIETPEQLAKLVKDGDATSGKYYVLGADIYLNDVSAENWTDSAIQWVGTGVLSNTAFQGTLDGAGHTIYGIYSNVSDTWYMGLFTKFSGNVTIKNITISDSYINNSHSTNGYAGVLTGNVLSGANVNISKCRVTESVTVIGNNAAGGLIAYGIGNSITIDSSAVFANISSANGKFGSMIGNVWNTTRTITNSFATAAIAFNGYQTAQVTFTSVYGVGDAVTDETGVVRLESADLMKGAAAKTNMPNLNWRGVWQTTESGYPTYRDPNGVKGEAWSGAVADNFAGGTGTAADPYLIETPEQLAKMLFFGITTVGQHYKLTADIYLNDVSAEDWTANSPISWYDYSDVSKTAFVGNLDGAGYTIHGLYYNGDTYVGLFPYAKDTTVTNLRISNADMTSTSVVSALIGFVTDANTISIKKCIVDETVKLTTTSTDGVGGFVGRGSASIYIEDSAVMATITADSYKGAFFGNCWNTSAQRSVTFSYSALDIPLTGHTSHGISVNNTYRIGEDPSASIITGSAIALDSADLMKGTAAKTNMPLLDWGIWTVTESGFPVISGETPEGYYTIEELDGLYKTQGRTELSNGALFMEWSASGIEFNANCSGDVAVTLNTERITTGDNGGIYFTVVVDGVVQYEDLRIPEDNSAANWLSNSTGYPFHIKTAGKSKFVIAEDLPEGNHSFAIYTQTEAKKGTFGITAIDLNGEFIAPPEDNELYIEFIGDSITASYGNLATDRDAEATLYEDATRGWPYLTAKTLGADWSVIAVSAITAGNGYGWSGAESVSMQAVYPKTRYYSSNATDYAFTRQPDAVVLGLGTNDLWTYADYDKTTADVEAEFEAMLTLVREKNPNAKIVWVYGMMRDEATSIIKKAVADMGGKSSGIYTFALPASTDGGNGHPSLAAQTTYSELLSEYLTDVINNAPDEDEIWDGTLEPFAKGSGTAADPYLIENAEQLAYMAVMGDQTSGKYFELTTDIYLNDVSADNWTDSATEWVGKSVSGTAAFQGALDGAGHKIYGIYINGDDSQYVGLVTATGGTATFKNVIISDSQIVNNYSSNASAAAFVGLGSGTVNFEKCGITESVEVISASVAGGFVANGNCVVNISDSYSLGHFESLVDLAVDGVSKYRRGSMVGGIYWSEGGTRNVTITNSFAIEAFSTYYVGTITNSYTAEALDTATYTVAQATYVAASSMKGAVAKANMPDLDWKAVWQTTDSDYPVLRNPNGVKGEVWSGAVAEDYAAGSGTALNPYVIETPEQLAKMVTEGNTETGKYYVLGADIYLNDVFTADWASNSPNSWYDYSDISKTAFVGNLDGAGYTIHGLYYNGSTYVGLFPYAKDTTVTNLRISNADMTSTSVVSALIGFVPSENTISIKKCIVDDTVKLTTTSTDGIAGFVGRGSAIIVIEDSAVMATITADSYKGAFFGNCWSGKRTIKNSFSATDAPMTGHNNNSITVENCYNIGTENLEYTGTVNKLDSADLMKGADALDNMPLLSGFYATASYPTVFYSGIEGSAWSGAVADRFAGGNGSSNNPYVIKTAEQLVRMLKTDTTGKYYVLTADIKLNKEGSTDNSWFTSKSEGIKTFKGTLNGNGYVISGLYYNGSIEWNNTNVGFIPIASNATVAGITIIDSEITLYSTLAEYGASYVGGIIGFVDDDSRVTGCYVDDTVKLSNTFADNSNSTNAQVGGLIGGGDASILIDGCVFTGELAWTEGARYGAAVADIWLGQGAVKTIKNTFTANYAPTSTLSFNGSNNISTVAFNTELDLDSSYTVAVNATGKAGLEAIASINKNDKFYWTESFPALKATGIRMGDINGDRKGNALDMTALRKHLLGAAEAGLTDLNEDGFTDVRDLVNLKKKQLSSSALVDFEPTSEYVIVYDADNAELYDEAVALKEYYLLNEGIAMQLAAAPAAAEKTITLTVDTDMGDGAYSVSRDGDNIVISGGHTQTAIMANREFLRNSQNGKIALFNLNSDFTSTSPIGDDYVYVWGDEFEQDSLDISKWDRYHRVWNQTSGADDIVIDYSNSSSSTNVEDGLLKLSADNYIDSGEKYVVPATVSTKDSMSFKYGYLEMRAKIPFGTGVWPGFWMSSGRAINSNQDADYTIEVDIFEQFASNDTVVPNIHKWYRDGSGKHTQWAGEDVYTFTEWENLNSEYHLYGIKWTPTEITMYVDGEAYYTYDLTSNFDNGESGMAGFDTTMSILINNHLFTQTSSYKPYEGCEIENAEENLPAEYYIDWIRLYQNGEGELNLAN